VAIKREMKSREACKLYPVEVKIQAKREPLHIGTIKIVLPDIRDFKSNAVTNYHIQLSFLTHSLIITGQAAAAKNCLGRHSRECTPYNREWK